MTQPDRLASGYQPDFDIDYEIGKQGELYVLRIIDSLKEGQRVEVKTDEMAERTGNVYVEYACKYRGEWKPSGIAITQAPLWAFVIGEAVVVAQTDRLKDIARYYWDKPGHLKNCKVGSHPTRGVTIPLRELIRMLAYGTPSVRQPRLDDAA